MHRISIMLAAGVMAGVVSALPAGRPALAYAAVPQAGTAAVSVAAGSPLTAAGPAVTFASNATTSTPPIPVTARVTNPNGFHRWAHTVTVSFVSSNRSGCAAAAYRITGSPVAVNRPVPPNGGRIAVTGVSVGLAKVACRGTTVKLRYRVT